MKPFKAFQAQAVCLCVRLLVRSSGFEQILYWGRQQIDHADEGVIVPVSSGPAFGCLEDSVECLDPGIVVSRYPASQDGCTMVVDRIECFTDRLEQIDVRNQLYGDIDEIGQSPLCCSHRSRFAYPTKHLLDAPCFRGLHIHAHQICQGIDLLFGQWPISIRSEERRVGKEC